MFLLVFMLNKKKNKFVLEQKNNKNNSFDRKVILK